MASFDQAIPPGGVGKIVLTVKTEGYQGRVNKTALVKSNDPRHESLSLSLSADIRAYVVVEPARMAVLQGVVGDDIRQVLRIRAGDGYPLELREPSSNMDQWLDYKLLTKEGSHLYDLEVRSKSQTQTTVGGYIRLVTNHPKTPELTVPVQLRVRPEFEVVPPVVAFGRVTVPSSPGEKVVRAITLVDNRGRDIRVRELDYNQKLFKATLMPFGGDNASRCRIEVEPRLDRLPAGSASYTLIIKLDGSKTGEVKIPVTIVVQKRGTETQ
ncbi:MAG TPA: hypothetical protein VEI04_06825 [Syntrophobacteria bacterium]|nr:hypothetical protein [Syntrophobacteria bacterium]